MKVASLRLRWALAAWVAEVVTRCRSTPRMGGSLGIWEKDSYLKLLVGESGGGEAWAAEGV